MTARNTIRLVKAIAVAALLVAAPARADWDFLWRDATGNCAARSQSPYARAEREYRVEPLAAAWVHDGDELYSQVEYAGETWICRDGSIVPNAPRPRIISKLDLLLALRELDKTAEFFAWLDASGLREFWNAAQVLATDHPLYNQALTSVQEALGLSDAERDAILESITKPMQEVP